MLNYRFAAAIAAAAAGLALLAGAGAAHASSGRPHLAASASAGSTLTPLVQEFGANTSPFCPAGNGNVPCDGAVGDYGTISRVASGTGGVTALDGSHYAETAGSQATSSGCPSTTSEYCTGPYALFDGGGVATFPSQGFTVTADLYLTRSEPGDITADIGLNNNDGAYGNDIFINFCPVASGGLAVSAGTMESCDGATTAQVTKAGWYRLVWDFTPDAGTVALNQSVSSEATGYAVWQGELDAPVSVNGVTATPSNTGGPSYFWIPTENTNSLPLANFAVQLGSYPGGSAPDKVKVRVPDARISVRAGTLIRFRVHADSSAGASITGWSITPGLGLSVNKSGLVRGKVTRSLHRTVTLTATDSAGITGSATFRLVVRK